VQYRGKIKPESVKVFNTIILAKAETITKDPMVLERIRKKTQNAAKTSAFLKELRAQNNDLKKVINTL